VPYPNARSRVACAFSRNTATRYSSAEEMPRYKQRASRPSFGASETYVVERVLPAAPETIATPALLRALPAGYGGHLRSLQALMSSSCVRQTVQKPDASGFS